MTETAKNLEGSTPSEEHIALMRPYLRLVKYLPDEFVELCIELLFLVREYGISKVVPTRENPAEFPEFLAHVHDGWKEAQTRIAQHLTSFLTELNYFTRLEKEHRATRNKTGQISARQEQRRIHIQIRVLRRILDGYSLDALSR
jgi:hypothetical protein